MQLPESWGSEREGREQNLILFTLLACVIKKQVMNFTGHRLEDQVPDISLLLKRPCSSRWSDAEKRSAGWWSRKVSRRHVISPPLPCSLRQRVTLGCD